MKTMNASVSLSNRIASHVAALPKSGIRDFFELVNSMDDVISLGVGEPDFVTPWPIREATIYALEKGHTQYTSNLGLMSFRKAVCKNVIDEFGVEYSPETECIATVGVSEGLDLILRALIEPGDEVIYHEPCYVSYAPSILMMHGVPVPVMTQESDEFALDPQALADKITPKTKVLLLNFPNNPTGANLSFEQKEQISKIAVDNDLIVISDEIYRELTYGEKTQSIAAFPGMRERTVLLHGFSKAYAMTGYRIGYACGPVDLIDAMMKIHQYTMLCASILAQEAAVEALTNCRRDMLNMREEYEQRRNVIVKRFNDLGLPCVEPEGAFYVFPNISSTGLDATEFAQRLLMEEKVAVVPGSAFSTDPAAGNYIRCAYATALEDIETAMQKIGAMLSRLKAT
jgi:aminotransferase